MSRQILVVGAGYIFQNNHYLVLQKLNEPVAAVVEPAQAIIEQLKVILPKTVKYYTSIQDVDLQNITHALVATPAGLHYDIIKYLSNYNINVLCEKPITVNAEQARELYDIYKNKEAILQIGFQRRWFTTSVKIKEYIDNKTFGNLSHINIWAGWVAKGSLPQSILNKKLSGGGISFDYGVHFIDLLMYWSKGIELVDYCDDSEGGIEVNSVTALKMDIGQPWPAFAKIYQSWTNVMANTIQLYFDDALIVYSINNQTRLEIVRLDNQSVDVRKVFKTEVVDLSNEAEVDATVSQWEEFFAQSEKRQGFNYVSDLQDAVRATEFVELCYNNKKKLALNWGL